MIGGAEQVEWQLREAASRSPVRFMRLLTEHGSIFLIALPTTFWMAHRLISLIASEIFSLMRINEPIEEPDPEVLASPDSRRDRAASGPLVSLPVSSQSPEGLRKRSPERARCIAIALRCHWILNFWEGENDDDSRELIGVGINMARGDAAEAVMIVATHWAEKNRQFPELLVPTLRRFARDPNPAIRALILRRLPYFQSLAPELGWEFFTWRWRKDERLWEIAEPCLYYAYHNQFAQVSLILDRIISSVTGKALETWGRISALAVFLDHVAIDDFVPE